MDSGEKYDAFISYSHKLDEELAKRLQPGIERFAKPWYRMRRLRVFRDDASLSASPRLWESIERALAASEWLILLASPEAAQSPWIEREVQWWLENKPDPVDHLLIAVTDGCPPWDPSNPASSESTSIIPPALQGHLATEPRWVDLRDVRIQTAKSDYRTRLEDAVADLAAAIWGEPKDFVYGEAFRQHRRTVRLARQAVAVMAALTLAAVAGGIFANVQRADAVAQANLANSRQLVAESSAIEANHPGLARQLLATADRVDPTSQVEGALMNSFSIPGELDLNGDVRAEAYMTHQPILAIGTDTGLHLVNTATGRPLATLTSHSGYVSAVSFRSDSRIMASGDADGDVRLWDVVQPSRPELIETMNSPLGIVNGLAFTPNGDILAAAYDDQVVVLWDVQNPARPVVLSSFPAKTGFADIAVAISPDGRVLAASGIGSAVQLWNITDPRHPAKLAALPGPSADALAFSPNGHLLASGDTGDFNVHVWDVTNPAQPQSRPVLSGHTSAVDSLAFSPDGNLLASGSWDHSVKIWNLADPTHPSVITTLAGHGDFVTAVAFSPDGQTLAGGSYDQTVFLWNVADPGSSIPLATLSGSAGPIAFSPNSKFVAAGSPAELWNISDPAAPRATAALAPSNVPGYGGVQALDFSPNGKLLAMYNTPGDTLLWGLGRPAQPKLVATMAASSGYPDQELAFSSTGHNLITPGESRPKIWNIRVPSRPVPLAGPAGTAATGAKTSFYGSSVSPADLTALWQASSPGSTASLESWISHHQNAQIVAISPKASLLTTLAGSSQQLAASDTQQLDLWDANHPVRPLASLTSSIGGLMAAAISPDGEKLAAASSTGVSIWDISNPAHPAALTTLNFGSASGEPVLTFSASGSYLATGGYGASDQIWELDQPGILNRLCAEIGSTITEAQWAQYVPGVAYSPPCSAHDYLPGTGSEIPSSIPVAPAPTVKVPVSDLHDVDWQNTPVPGQFCDVSGLVRIKKGQGWASSAKWGRVQFYVSSPVLYGNLQGGGTQDAAVQVWCDNGGGTADGQIAEAYLIYRMRGRTLTLIGAVTPQEQPSDQVHVSFFGSVSILPGSVVAHEEWYRPSDATCCPTGKAITVWTYTHGRLVSGTPDITS